MQNNSNLEVNIDYTFKNKELLELALIHPSYANEHNLAKYETNQRLEFLGDSVLELISSDFLYKRFRTYDEGNLTKIRAKLVCEDNLSDVARSLGIYDYLLLGKGESAEKAKNNNSIMCDAIEAIIGAIYLDSDINYSYKFVNKFILTEENINKSNSDFKSLLQEIANSHGSTVRYELEKESGPDHDKMFYINLIYNDKLICQGVGKSKKDAEQSAASIALTRKLLNK